MHLETQDICALTDDKLSQLFLGYLDILIFKLPL